jgi:hypothetical protein
MHDHGSIIEKPQSLELVQFVPRLYIDSFARVDDERATFGRSRTRCAKIAAQRYGMAPAVTLKYSHWKPFSLKLWPKRIMVADRCCATQQVAYSTPPKPHLSWHRSLLRDDLGELVVYVGSPINVVLIGWIREFGIESKLQMIMGVDEARHHKIVTEIDFFGYATLSGPAGGIV